MTANVIYQIVLLHIPTEKWSLNKYKLNILYIASQIDLFRSKFCSNSLHHSTKNPIKLPRNRKKPIDVIFVNSLINSLSPSLSHSHVLSKPGQHILH